MEIIEILSQLFKGGTVAIVIGVILATLWVVNKVYKMHLEALDQKDKIHFKEVEKLTNNYEERISALEIEVRENRKEIEQSKRDREALRSENDKLHNILLVVLGAEKLQSIKAML